MVKNVLLTITLTLMLSTSLNAYGFDFTVGIKGGVGANYFNNNSGAKQRYSTANVAINGYFEWGIARYFSVQFEGGMLLNNELIMHYLNQDKQLSWQAISLAFYPKMRFNLAGPINFYTMAGAAFLFGIGDITTQPMGPVPYNFLMKPQIQAVGSAGFELAINKNFVVVGVKSIWSLTSQFINSSYYPRLFLHHPVMVELGYALRL
jgi:hypothetical protein